jgi:hypothetical protein
MCAVALVDELVKTHPDAISWYIVYIEIIFVRTLHWNSSKKLGGVFYVLRFSV